MTMQGLSAVAIGTLALLVAFTIIPIVGSQLDRAITMPGCAGGDMNTSCTYSGYAVGGKWNSTVNTNIVTGVSVWQALGGILKVGGIIVVVAGFLTTLRGMRS